jgi:tRNA pseudouridine55 synthase
VQYLKDVEKYYEGTFGLGFSTDTFDREGNITSERIVPETTQEKLDEYAADMTGESWQAPPPFSAKKIHGVRAYALARRGVEVAISPRKIRVLQFTLHLRTASAVDFQLRCSAGTYVRSLANDLGVKLQCGAHLQRLRRLGSGQFTERESIDFQELQRLDRSALLARMVPLTNVLLHLQAVVLDASSEQDFSHGRKFVAAPQQQPICAGGIVRVLGGEGRFLGLAEPLVQEQEAPLSDSTLFLRPVLVLEAHG